ncbi:MAG TPA: DUF2505 family protein [Myxococcota bacterium]|nr:DUF2505 family protein [Myxococcota bacterium]HOA13871.1 DUF2505 family protein [Myxococcota bacterium]HOH76395.1 DUF2505 family protein [Myxococcota bacterium]
MKFRYEHDFQCDRKKLVAAMFADGVTESLKADMKTLTDASTLEWRQDGGRIFRRVRYLLVPIIDEIAGRKVDPKWMEWIEEAEVDVESGRATFRNVPTTPSIAAIMENTGTMEFVDLGGGRTRRIVSGELKIKVFLVGMVAEVIIADKARGLLDDEAAAMRLRLQAEG